MCYRRQEGYFSRMFACFLSVNRIIEMYLSNVVKFMEWMYIIQKSIEYISTEG